MTRHDGCLISFGYLLFVLLVDLAANAPLHAASPESVPKPVLIELFTSEGCSSCPPADVLLQKLVAQQPVPGAEIIALEEHVDYWNHDGWVDSYSSPEWTERQQSYVRLINKDAYTPELVVDGRSQFSGNDAFQAEFAIEKAAREEKTEVKIAAQNPAAKGPQQFDISIGKLPSNMAGDTAEVWLAVTEDGLHSSVSAGENAGHLLTHVATLRSLRKIGVADAGSATSFTGNAVVKLNSHWKAQNVHVTVFVQRKKSREILGAATIRAAS